MHPPRKSTDRIRNHPRISRVQAGLSQRQHRKTHLRPCKGQGGHPGGQETCQRGEIPASLGREQSQTLNRRRGVSRKGIYRLQKQVRGIKRVFRRFIGGFEPGRGKNRGSGGYSEEPREAD